MAQGKKVPDGQVEEWIRRYEAGESALAIAQATGYGHQTVWRYLRERGVELRGRAKVAKLAYEQHESVREALASHRGEKHWNWKGGITERADLQHKAYKNARRVRFARANDRCEECGLPAAHIHHLDGPGHDVENLRALCEWCHAQKHSRWPSDEELLADMDGGMKIKRVCEKYGVSANTARLYRHYARGLTRGRKLGGG
jgi:5-methylcytosine-specific restriction endonuclease McrA